MIINHNIAALNTLNNLSKNTAATQKSLEKLSSGLRINRAGDDAAGLAISEKMRGQIRGLDMASKNAQDGVSMIQTAEGALNETHDILQRMRELAVQSSNDSNTSEDRKNIQDEIVQLGNEIDRIGNQTEFNTKKLLNGQAGAAQTATAGTIVNSGNLGTGVGDATTLDSLVDKAGNNLGIANGDTITATWSVNGSQKNATFAVTDITSDALSDITDAVATDASVTSAATAAGVTTITAAGTGTAGQINGFSIEVKSSTGERKEAASNALSNFAEGTQAKDVRTDGSSTFHIGANAGQTINLSIEDMRATTLGVNNLQVGTQSQAETAVKVLDQATQKVSAERSKLGAYQNRLEHTINNLTTSSENLNAAESRIRDVDMAKEMSNFTKNNILNQAAQAMLAQSNQLPQGVLQLLR
ncbi:flagellin N-terminal helical domain-containing protein [Sporolactobacillus inulinus]|uniref:Flagellin n=1 Tax=Sporolactobacillus inulinus CASD TaxID=1069536 RepID=A0A0U1QPT9_9BACL|nr:flagellin [Sporolactobacillus inulinus]KLI02818.1 flagellin [Sporolactobacillus inulinus CASD]GEB78092.1 flagellin [Sporolactobacillus inulinus]